MSRSLRSLYGLKWNPFSPEVPLEAVVPTPRMETFCWRVEALAEEGGFALLDGEPGGGKSVTLRFTARKLALLPDLVVGVMTHPQSGVADLYRELGDLFGVALKPHNRWTGFRELRKRWFEHIETTLYRPVLFIDDAQMMQTSALSELRVLASADFDSRSILTVVLAANPQLAERFRGDELAPLGSRIRVRLRTDSASHEELGTFLRTSLKEAGCPHLMTTGLVDTLVERSCGNYRVLKNLADELLQFGFHEKARQLDEELYLKVFGGTPPAPRSKPERKGGGR